MGGVKAEELPQAGGGTIKGEAGGVVKAEPVDGAAAGSVSVKEEEREAPLKKPSARERCACLLFLPASPLPLSQPDYTLRKAVRGPPT